MKKMLSFTAVFCLSCFFHAWSQETGEALKHFVFPAFKEGTVKQKSGEVNTALLNYNTITEEMIFEQSGRQLALDKLEDVDTVFIEDRKFVPAGKVFYEMATNTPIALFIQHKSDVVVPGGNTGFGTSQTSAITNFTDLKRAGAFYKLQLPEDYKITSKSAFWLGKNRIYHVLRNLKDVQQLFPDKADAIKEFVKANQVNFKDPATLIRLVEFCN